MKFTNTDCIKDMVPKVFKIEPLLQVYAHLSWKVYEQIYPTKTKISQEIK